MNERNVNVGTQGHIDWAFSEKSNERKELLRRAKEYAEFYEATRNYNTLGFFNDLIKYLDNKIKTTPKTDTI